MKDYKTVARVGLNEIQIQKSRFIGHVAPVSSEEEAIHFIEDIRKKHWNATHNVPVYLIGEDYKVQRYSDDGEPSGTAGIPIMEMLKKEGITNICVVITRYFGGIKLGTGGLVRAYTESAKSTLEAIGIIEKRVFHHLKLSFDYTLHGKLQFFCMNHACILIDDTQFSEHVEMTINIAYGELDAIVKELINLTSDNIVLGEPEICYLTFRDEKLMMG
jgi:uncharacterized YigZ family protein